MVGVEERVLFEGNFHFQPHHVGKRWHRVYVVITSHRRIGSGFMNVYTRGKTNQKRILKVSLDKPQFVEMPTEKSLGQPNKYVFLLCSKARKFGTKSANMFWTFAADSPQQRLQCHKAIHTAGNPDASEDSFMLLDLIGRGMNVFGLKISGDHIHDAAAARDASLMRKLDLYCRYLNLIQAVASAVGCLSLVVHHEVTWVDEGRYHMLDSASLAGMVSTIVAFVCTLISFLCLFFYYHYKAKGQQIKSKSKDTVTAFFASSLKWIFAWELLLLVAGPVPLARDMFTWGFGRKTIPFPMALRWVWFSFRAIRDSSSLYKDRHKYINHNGLQQHVTTLRVLKVYFVQNPVVFITCFFLFGWMVFSYIIYIVERGFYVNEDATDVLSYDGSFTCMKICEGKVLFHNDIDPIAMGWQPSVFGNFWECMWFTMVTMISIGYGDLYPATNVGKMFAEIIAVTGVIMHGLIVGVSTITVEARPFEAFLERWLRENELNKKLLYLSARVVQTAWRRFKKRKLLAAAGDTRAQQELLKTRDGGILRKARPLILRIRAARKALNSLTGVAYDDVSTCAVRDIGRIRKKIILLAEELYRRGLLKHQFQPAELFPHRHMPAAVKSRDKMMARLSLFGPLSAQTPRGAQTPRRITMDISPTQKVATQASGTSDPQEGAGARYTLTVTAEAEPHDDDDDAQRYEEA